MAVRNIDYELVARRQQRVLLIVLVMVASNFGLLFSSLLRGTVFSQVMAVEILFLGIYWASMLMGLVAIILLMVAEKKHPLIIILLSLLMFVPLINLLVLIHVNSEATMMLKAQEIKVGLLGVSPAERIKLRTGHCRGCGYDRTGIELLGPCPECGRVPEVW